MGPPVPKGDGGRGKAGLVAALVTVVAAIGLAAVASRWGGGAPRAYFAATGESA